MKKTVSSIINEAIKKVLNEAVEWPAGFFEVTNTFKFGGGAWRMTFPKGALIKVENEGRFQGVTQKMYIWDALKQDWVPKSPPISSMRGGNFDLGGFNASDAQSWVDEFTKNTKSIGEAQAMTTAKNMAQEKTLKARAAIKMLQKLSGNQMVKITIV